MNLTESIKQKALELGFNLVGVTDAEPIEAKQVDYLRKWLDAGNAAGMEYMHRNFEKRINPGELFECAQSVICVGLNYKPAPREKINIQEPVGIIANFALYEDYHDFIKSGLFQLTDYIKNTVAPKKFRFKICVDSAPLAERALAARAGLGFIGKNHMLINPQLGCQILLGELITDLELEYDMPKKNHCPDCYKCVRACPTGALKVDGTFDSRKCISYLTIEHKNHIQDDVKAKIGKHLFGCDECILACPYELNAPSCSNKEFAFHADRLQIKLKEILDWQEADFEKYFKDSSVERLGLDRLKRNAQICLNNQKAD